ncbi:LOW QUALITY PROTEIN: hypothetical protein AAY473_037210 [Plecturocebus cupreus]
MEILKFCLTIWHNCVASLIKTSTSSGGDLETLPQQALPRNHVASSIKSSTSSGEDLETLAQQALQCNCVVTANIGNKDLETLILQALQHDLMASSFTQRTTQSTVAQQSSQEATVLQGRQPEAVLAWPISSWGCRKAARRCISILMRGPNKPSSITACPPPSWYLHQQSAPPEVLDLETLAQQALPCNCVVAACIGNKDLETLTLQALQHDLMASSFPGVHPEHRGSRVITGSHRPPS